MNNYPEIQELLEQRADLYARLKLLTYDGTPEIKENKSGKYLYVRKRVGSRVTSTYVDVYSDTLYQLLLRNNAEAKELRKQIRKVEKALAEKGFTENEFSPDVLLNLDFARMNMKLSIYEQAVLEGVATSFPQTEDILENGKVNLSIKRLEPKPQRENGGNRNGNYRGAPRQDSGYRRENSVPAQNRPQRAPMQPAAPKTADQLFEEKLKAFMSESDNKLSSMRADHRTKSRRR